MALNIKDLTTLAMVVAKADKKAPTSYSFEGESFNYSELNETLRGELNQYACNYRTYRENKNLLFALIEQVIDDVLPAKVMEQYSMFAEIKTFKQGDKPVFTQKITAASRKRAKQFITKVGLAGVYEVFKLDGKSYEVQTSAYGGAAQIGFEEFLDGRVDFAEVLEIILEGLDEVIYTEIAKALEGSVANLQAGNKTSQTAFDEAEMDKMIAVAGAYGVPVIYCTHEFAATMLPASGWVSDDMRNEKWANGYLGNYKGKKVVVMNQSFTDETNTVKVVNPAFAYIIPTGGNDKPVKIALEGETIVDEYVNADRSREVQVYKKVGVAATITNNICVYENTSLTK